VKGRVRDGGVGSQQKEAAAVATSRIRLYLFEPRTKDSAFDDTSHDEEWWQRNGGS